MHGAELLVPYFMADRHREASQARLARLARESSENESPRIERKKHLDRSGEPLAAGRRPSRWLPIDDKSWMPRLRGYPVDTEFAQR
jgi:hypothetical protein